ncbi:MAG: hypothetical protein KGV59_05150 [Tenacibaculum sp.]|nr:hypothetical protein [Tenacibaculum sp.]
MELIEKRYNFKFPEDYKLLKNDELFTLLTPQEIIDLVEEKKILSIKDVIPFAVQFYDLDGANNYYFIVKNKNIILNYEFEIVANNLNEFIFFTLLDFMYRKQNGISVVEFKEIVSKLIKRYSNSLNKKQKEIINKFHKRKIFSHTPIEDMPKTIWFKGFLTKKELDEIKTTADTVYK